MTPKQEQEKEKIIEQIAMEIGRISGASDVAIIINDDQDVARIVACHKDTTQGVEKHRVRLIEMLRGVARNLEDGGGESSGRDGQTVVME